jgi:hypothetical protein
MYTLDNFVNDFENNNIKLVWIGTGYNKEYRAKYNRYVIYANDLKLNHYNAGFISKLPYYSKRSQAMAMTVWGMSQEFEARAKLTELAMYHKLGKYDHDYFYKYVDKVIKVYGY